MDDLVWNDYVYKVLWDQLDYFVSILWYLFYYFVFNLNKLDKICVMFDCMVKYQGILLNN